MAERHVTRQNALGLVNRPPRVRGAVRRPSAGGGYVGGRDMRAVIVFIQPDLACQQNRLRGRMA